MGRKASKKVANVSKSRATKTSTKTRASQKSTTKTKLLSGDNPQIAKGDGDAPVQAWIDAIPGWKRDVARRLDGLVVRALPDVVKAVKWNSPLYGVERGSWFLGLHCFTKYVKVAFFRGARLRPVPPGTSKQADVRYLDVREGDVIDEAVFVEWVRQAAALPGEKM